MFKSFMMLIFLHLSLMAQTPHLFKAVGDPIYSEIPAVQSLLKISYFDKDKVQLKTFITKAKAHQKLGLRYDKKRRNKILSKQEQKAYLDGLRSLKKELYVIYDTVRMDLQKIIKNNDSKTFYRLRRTKLDILHIDPKSAQAIARYERKLTKKRRLAKERKAQEAKRAKRAHYTFLRSSANLNGKWKGKNSDGSKMLANFTKKSLYLTYKADRVTTVFKGSYRIEGQNFKFFIEHRKRTKSDISHIKKVNFERNYALIHISETELVLRHKDETITLKRKPIKK